MNFREYGPLLTIIYEAGSYITGHQQFPIKFFEQTDLPLINRSLTKGLEAGCGTLRWTTGLTKAERKKGTNLNHLVVDAFDMSVPSLRIAERKARKHKVPVQLWQADGADLSYARSFYNQSVNGTKKTFQKEEFDWLIIAGLFEVVKDPQQVAREMNRVVREGPIIAPLINQNPAGLLASKALHFNLIPPKEVFREFPDFDFEKVSVKPILSQYMTELVTVWVGYRK
ncbi:class I SAM-dependent methyltransferase [Candidatus Woesearchaeota archaeon]|nr:class I SAM-dependent methyltransferase [Candidatus Woesearchaeota archaeon]MBW3005830.1 class I SAM-dependent methyltransferase [Candidatus Woesearchaeota archaeon]